jgi:hypothetical protein
MPKKFIRSARSQPEGHPDPNSGCIMQGTHRLFLCQRALSLCIKVWPPFNSGKLPLDHTRQIVVVDNRKLASIFSSVFRYTPNRQIRCAAVKALPSSTRMDRSPNEAYGTISRPVIRICQKRNCSSAMKRILLTRRR